MKKKANREYEIVKYHPGYKQAVAEFQKMLWSPDASLNSSYLEWKHERNPYLAAPMVYLALCDGKIVGMRSILGAKWEAGNPPERFEGLCAEDLLIAPEHRNHGLHSRLMKELFRDLEERGCRHVFSLSAGTVTVLSSLAMGWRNAGAMQPFRRKGERGERYPRLRKYARNTKFLWRFADDWPFTEWDKERNNLHGLCGPGGTEARRGVDPRIVLETGPRTAEMANLVSRLGSDGRIRHVRDEKYLSWRFRNPLHRYLFLYWVEEALEGFLVLQQYLSKRFPENRINIVDWEATSPQIREGLLRSAVRLCGRKELNSWAASLDAATKGMLGNAGFSPAPGNAQTAGLSRENPCLLVRTIPGTFRDTDPRIGGRRLLDMADWDVRMLYSMMG